MPTGRSEWDSALQFGRQLQNTYYLRKSSALPLNGTVAILDPNIVNSDGQPFQTTISGIFHSMLDNGSFNMPSGLYVSTEQVKTVSGYQPSGYTQRSMRNGFPEVVKRFSQEEYEGIQNQLEANWYLQAEIEFLASGRPAIVVEGDAPPPIPQAGELWYNTSTLELKIWYVDPSGDAQWVPTAVPLSSQEDFTALASEVQTISGQVQADVQNLATISGVLSSGIASRFSAYGGTISDNPAYFNSASYTDGNITMKRGSDTSQAGKIYARNYDNTIRYTLFNDGTFNTTSRNPIVMGSDTQPDAQVKVFGASGSYRPLIFKSSDKGVSNAGYTDMLRMVPGHIQAYNSYIVASGITDHMGLAVNRNGVNTWAVDGEGTVLQRSNKYVFDSPAEYTDIYDVGNSTGQLRFIVGQDVETALPSGVRLNIHASGVTTRGIFQVASSRPTGTGFGETIVQFGDDSIGSPGAVYFQQMKNDGSYDDFMVATANGGQVNFNRNLYIYKKSTLNQSLEFSGNDSSSTTTTWPGLRATSFSADGFYLSVNDQDTVISLQQGSASQLTKAVKTGKPPSSQIANFWKYGICLNKPTANRDATVFYTAGDSSNVPSNNFFPWVISGTTPSSITYNANMLLYVNKSSTGAGDRINYQGEIDTIYSLVNKKYVDDAINAGYAGGGTLTNPNILGTTTYGTSGEGQILNVLHKAPGSGLEIWVGSGSFGTSEPVANFAKEGVTYIKPTEFKNNVVVQETLQTGPLTYKQFNVANSLMHELNGYGHSYHAGSGTFLKNMYIKGDTLLMGNTTAKQLVVNNNTQVKGNLTVNGGTTQLDGILNVQQNLTCGAGLFTYGATKINSSFQVVNNKANFSQGAEIYTGLEVPTGDTTISKGKLFIDDVDASDNKGIEFRSDQTVQAIRAYGNVSKALKFFVGPTESDSRQFLSLQSGSDPSVILGNATMPLDISLMGSGIKQDFKLPQDSALQFVYGNTEKAALYANKWVDVPPIEMSQDASIAGVANIYGVVDEGNASLQLHASGTDGRVNFLVDGAINAYASSFGLVAPDKTVQSSKFNLANYNSGYSYLNSFGNTQGLMFAVAPPGAGGGTNNVVNTLYLTSNSVRPQNTIYMGHVNDDGVAAKITQLPDPTEDTDATNMKYVKSLMTGLYAATNNSTDFAQLKSNFIATLSGYINGTH